MSNDELQNRAEASHESTSQAAREKKWAEQSHNEALSQVKFLRQRDQAVHQREAAAAELDGAVLETRKAQEKVRTKVSI